MTARKPSVERADNPDRRWIDDVGFYAVRLAKGAPEVGCEVTYGPALDPETGLPLDRSWLWVVTVNGDEVHHCSPMRPQTVHVGRRITEAEYRFLIDDRAWAAEHAPHLPEANPRRAVPRAERPIPFL